MASPSTVISEGFGAWGSAGLLVTDGYGIGAAVVANPAVVHGTWADSVPITGTWADLNVTGAWSD